MAAGPLNRLRTLPVLPSSLGGVLPHSIWNQISIGLPVAEAGSAAFTRPAKFMGWPAPLPWQHRLTGHAEGKELH